MLLRQLEAAFAVKFSSPLNFIVEVLVIKEIFLILYVKCKAMQKQQGVQHVHWATLYSSGPFLSDACKHVSLIFYLLLLCWPSKGW